MLQREQKSAAPALTGIAYGVVIAIALSLLALLAWGLHRLGTPPGERRPPPSRRSAPRRAAANRMILLDPLARLLGLAGWTRPPSSWRPRPYKRRARPSPPCRRLSRLCWCCRPCPSSSPSQRNTEVLPEILERLDRVEHDTAVLPVMRGDTAAIAAEMPKLVVLEQSLPAVAEGVHHPWTSPGRCTSAARRLGRWGDRLPQRAAADLEFSL